MREAVVELDAEGRVRSFTPGTQGPFAALADEKGRYLVDRLRASDRVVFLHAHARVRAGEPRVDIAVRLRLDEAGREWIEASLGLVSGGDGVIVLLHDETRAADAEPDAGETGTPNEKHAEAVDPLADLAHELRTPLNAVCGYAGALEAELFGPLNERQRDAVAAIASASEHVVELSNAVLDAARFGASGAVRPIDGPIEDAVVRACGLVANLASRHRVTVANRVTARIGSVPHDAAALRQIVLNLLSNAVKASAAGATVCIDATRDGERLELTVRDSGCGMEPAALAALGTRFARGVQAADEATGGLGLPLVRRLAEAHGGTLRFASQPGRGTVATVSLPLVAPEASLRPTVVPLAARVVAENTNRPDAGMRNERVG